MSGLVEFKMTGLAELQAQLLELGAETGVRTLAAAARRAFKPVLEAAIANCPVGETGELKASIRLATVKKGEGDAVLSVGLRIAATKGSKGVPPARRWHWTELGTVHSAAHPFLRPALDSNASVVLDLLRADIEKSIQRVLKKRARG